MVSIPPDIAERVYDFITEDDEGRICKQIHETACIAKIMKPAT